MVQSGCVLANLLCLGNRSVITGGCSCRRGGLSGRGRRDASRGIRGLQASVVWRHQPRAHYGRLASSRIGLHSKSDELQSEVIAALALVASATENRPAPMQKRRSAGLPADRRFPLQALNLRALLFSHSHRQNRCTIPTPAANKLREAEGVPLKPSPIVAVALITAPLALSVWPFARVKPSST